MSPMRRARSATSATPLRPAPTARARPRLVGRLAVEHGVAGSAEQRSAVGDPAALLGQIAAEEAADVIVVGSRERGRVRRALESRLVRQLATETPVPVLIAPPQKRHGRKITAPTRGRR
jgi:nucleotide-binding universal stress UspA family protein